MQLFLYSKMLSINAINVNYIINWRSLNCESPSNFAFFKSPKKKEYYQKKSNFLKEYYQEKPYMRIFKNYHNHSIQIMQDNIPKIIQLYISWNWEY